MRSILAVPARILAATVACFVTQTGCGGGTGSAEDAGANRSRDSVSGAETGRDSATDSRRSDAPPKDARASDTSTPDVATVDAPSRKETGTADAGVDSGRPREAGDASPAPIDLWTFAGGSQSTDEGSSYGTLGTAAPTNTPGARYGGATWAGANGELWLFGGSLGSVGGQGNDLWKYDGVSWAWMGGSSTKNASGVYGTKGASSASSVPGARYFGSSWKDGAGKLWLSGGYGADSVGDLSQLDDVWRFDGTGWTWVAGSATGSVVTVYGTLGTAAEANTPGGRDRAVTWLDAAGDAWLFGGLDIAGHDRGDLWRFDGLLWTWMGGSGATNVAGVYGTKGTASPTNMPGARQDSVSWVDGLGHFWLYGGYGYDSAGAVGDLNDLWKFDGTSWTWVTGASTVNVAATYGTLGLPATTNDPGCRENAVSWIDARGRFWLMSGTSSHDVTELNDLWRFDGTAWTWITGSKTPDAVGTYGAAGMAGSAFTPGGRDSAMAWNDGEGNLWLYGGYGAGASAGDNDLSDLWHYQP